MVCKNIHPTNSYEEIKFVYACFAAEAVNREELRHWAELQLESCNNPELLECYAELAVFDGKLVGLNKLIDGIKHSWDGYGKHDTALAGIAYKRGITPFEERPTCEEALKAIEQCPELEQVFCKIFQNVKYIDK